MTSLPSKQHLSDSAIDAARAVTIEIVAETGSTNADLLARVPRLAGPVLRLAASQTAGRGRADSRLEAHGVGTGVPARRRPGPDGRSDLSALRSPGDGGRSVRAATRATASAQGATADTAEVRPSLA